MVCKIITFGPFWSTLGPKVTEKPDLTICFFVAFFHMRFEDKKSEKRAKKAPKSEGAFF